MAFKAAFMGRIRRALLKSGETKLFLDALQQACNTRWVVHCQPSLADADHVIRYLGQYTHRVAITNQRILNIDRGKVTFTAKDYRQRGVRKNVTLDAVAICKTGHIMTVRKLPRIRSPNPLFSMTAIAY